MKTLINFFIMAALLASVTFSQKQSTPQDAEKWVKKAIAFYKAEGKDKALEELQAAASINPEGSFSQESKKFISRYFP